MDICVVVPTYNRAKFIPFTLDSILRQTHAPREVIVVDDGSTDDTAETLRQFDNRIKYFRIENSGEFVARNFGVTQTTCPWIAFCDSDDLWDKDKLRYHVTLHEAAPHVEYSFSDFVIVSGNQSSSMRKFDGAPRNYWSSGKKVVAEDCWVFDESLYERLIAYQPIFPSSVFMRRSHFYRLGAWNTTFARDRVVDFEFHLRCVADPPVGVVNRPLVGIRKHPGNFSGNLINMLLGEIDVLNFALEHHKRAQLCAEAIRASIGRRQLNALDAAFLAGRFDLVKELYLEIQGVRPPLKATLKYIISNLNNTTRTVLARNLIRPRRANH